MLSVEDLQNCEECLWWEDKPRKWSWLNFRYIRELGKCTAPKEMLGVVGVRGKMTQVTHTTVKDCLTYEKWIRF